MGEMSKSPEEIKNFETKKELAYVAFGKVLYEGCHKIAAKALTYIQRLESDNAKKDETIQMLQDGNASLMKMIDEECEKTVRLERERDAAVKILTDIAHYEDWFGGVDICAVCKKDKCKECGNVNGGFEWHGAPEQEKNEPIRAD